MRSIAIAALVVLAAGCVQGPSTPPAASEPPPGASATDPGTSAATRAPADPLHWSGLVDLNASVLLLPWQTLRIDPGTTVRFHKLADVNGTAWTPQADAYIKDHNDPTGRVGYQQSHFMIYGQVVAVGTKGAPIRFTSASPRPEYADWNQIVLASGSRLENVTAAYSHDGINVHGDHVVLRNVVAHDSLWSCIDSFGTDESYDHVEAYHCWHQAVGFKGGGSARLVDAFLHDAQLAVNCEGGAQPVLLNVTTRAAEVALTCPGGATTTLAGTSDAAGGTYGGVLVYPYHG